MIRNTLSTLQPRTVGRALLVVVLLALIAPFVVYAVPATVGGEASYVVLTASMTPAIAPGDAVIVDDVPAESVGVGDVIVFQRQAGDEIPVTHRVIAVEQTADGTPAFRTKGDANEDVDMRLVTPDRLVGQVVFTLPYVGHVVRFVGTPVGFLALVVVPLGLLIVSEVATLVRSGGPSGGATEGDGPDDDGDGDGGDDGPGPADGPPPASHAAGATDEQVTVTPQDLTISLGVLGAFAVYAGYAAFQRPTGLSVGVAIATGATFLVVAGVRTFAPPSPLATGEAVVTSVRIDDRPATVELSSVADLRAVSAVVGRPVLSDGGRYVVLDGTVTYACPIPVDADPVVEEAAAASDADGAKTEPSSDSIPEATPSVVGGAGR